MTEDIEAFRKTLPIYEFKEEILKNVGDNTFTIITGDTGSGKSTQLPQYMIDQEEFVIRIAELRAKYYETIPL